MLNEIAESVAVKEIDMMGYFDPHDPEKNRKVLCAALESHLGAYRQAGIHPRCFANVNDFIAHYLKQG